MSRGREVTLYKAAIARDGVLISLQRQETPCIFLASVKECSDMRTLSCCEEEIKDKVITGLS